MVRIRVRLNWRWMASNRLELVSLPQLSTLLAECKAMER